MPVFVIVDVRGETPIYQQIRDQVVLGIGAGQLAPGDALPPARQLAGEFGVNVHTIAKAYDQLRQEGFVAIARRRGTVVVEAAADAAALAGWDARLRVLLAEARARGLADAAILERCRDILAAFDRSPAAPAALETRP